MISRQYRVYVNSNVHIRTHPSYTLKPKIFQFNGAQGGPDTPVGGTITARLVCNSNGQWTYTGPISGVTRVITEVNCVYNPTGK